MIWTGDINSVLYDQIVVSIIKDIYKRICEKKEFRIKDDATLEAKQNLLQKAIEKIQLFPDGFDNLGPDSRPLTWPVTWIVPLEFRITSPTQPGFDSPSSCLLPFLGGLLLQTTYNPVLTHSDVKS